MKVHEHTNKFVAYTQCAHKMCFVAFECLNVVYMHMHKLYIHVSVV